MDFNGIIFPSPSFDKSKISSFKDEIIFIPRNKIDKKAYIPVLFLKAQSKTPIKNYIIFFHGNAEDIFGARLMAERLQYKLNMNILIVEYPGYSIYDTMDKDSNTILEDTTIVYDYLLANVSNISEDNIFIFGRSIGTSPAIYLASKRKPSALFVVSAFTTIRAVAENIVGFLKVFLSERFKSIEYIKGVTCPIMFIHGQKDPLIPYKETELLKEACDCPKEVLFPENMTHNDYDLEEDIIEPINVFVNKHCDIEDNEPDKVAMIKEDVFVIPEEIEKRVYGKK